VSDRVDAFNALVRPKRAHTPSPAAIARPAGPRAEVIDAEFEPVTGLVAHAPAAVPEDTRAELAFARARAKRAQVAGLRGAAASCAAAAPTMSTPGLSAAIFNDGETYWSMADASEREAERLESDGRAYSTRGGR